MQAAVHLHIGEERVGVRTLWWLKLSCHGSGFKGQGSFAVCWRKAQSIEAVPL